MLSIKKLHIKVIAIFCQRKICSPSTDQKYFVDPNPHTDSPAMHASLLANDGKCVDFFHFRSGNFTHK